MTHEHCVTNNIPFSKADFDFRLRGGNRIEARAVMLAVGV